MKKIILATLSMAFLYSAQLYAADADMKHSEKKEMHDSKNKDFKDKEGHDLKDTESMGDMEHKKYEN